MIIVDNALKALAEKGKPIRVALLGAGFMGQGLTNMIVNRVPGMRMVAIFNRRVERALQVYQYSGLNEVVEASTQAQLEDAIRSGKPAITADAFLLAKSPQVDVIVDVTGSVEFGARVLLEAFQHGKHVVLMNAEIDATIGPILSNLRGQSGGYPVGVRGRRTGRSTESISLGLRSRAHSARYGKYQGTPGPLSESYHSERLCR